MPCRLGWDDEAMRPTLLIVDDHAGFRALARRLLGSGGFEVVGAAADGRAGVRDLARRSLRWRVGVRWYLLAVLGLPVVVLAGTIALFGTAAEIGRASCRERVYHPV